MHKLTEFDLKQIKLIEKKIGLFENNRLDLFDLISDLSGLLDVLESIDNHWKDDFKIEINTLELIHDSIEDGSISKWRGDFQKDIHESVLKLKNKVASIQAEHLNVTDPAILEFAIDTNFSWLICPKCLEAWESTSSYAMVVCSHCECILHNSNSIKCKTED
jgi:hypothetical protein